MWNYVLSMSHSQNYEFIFYDSIYRQKNELRRQSRNSQSEVSGRDFDHVTTCYGHFRNLVSQHLYLLILLYNVYHIETYCIW